jgi:hypothetical protein
MRPQVELAELHPPVAVQSWPTALESMVNSKSLSSTILKDCAAAATARAQLSQGDYSHGRTFWIGALNQDPKSTLERLALGIFYSHLNRQAARWSTMKLAKGDEFEGSRWTMDDVDLSCSGAEWWTLYMDGEDGGVGWHWDKDYHAELHHEQNIHPYLGTVSYFSEVGAPTIIFPKTTAGPTISSEDFIGYSVGEDGLPLLTQAYISRVLPGKHIAFDGRFLHAAPTNFWDQIQEAQQRKNKEGPSQRNRSKGPRSRPKRATFLVNVWINHKPYDAVPMEPALQSRLSKFKVSLDLSQHSPSEPYQVAVLSPLGSGADKARKDSSKKYKSQRGNECATATIETRNVETFEWELSNEYALIADMPVEALAESWFKADTLKVSWRKGTQRPHVIEEAHHQ